MENRNKVRRVLAVLLSVAVAVAFFPLLGDGAYAAEQNGNAGETYFAAPGETGEDGYVAADAALTQDEIEAELDAQNTASDLQTDPDLAIAAAEAEAEGPALEADAAVIDAMAAPEEVASECGKADVDGVVVDEMEAMAVEDEEELSAFADYGISVSVDASGIATVYAFTNESGAYFTSMYVDDDWVGSFSGKTYVSTTIDMKDYPVGYHTVELYYGGSQEGYYLYYGHVPTFIYESPTLSVSDIYSGYNYFTYSDDYNYYYYDRSCGLYLDYMKGNDGWNVGYGPVGYGSSGSISGLYSATTYSVRTYYAKATEYQLPTQGAAVESYTFTGNAGGIVSFKTGYSKTPVKSIKAKKIKQWCKKIKVKKLSSQIYYRYGYAGWGWYRKVLGTKTYKFWYTKIKVTVKMKKKPGVWGIYIGSKKVGGNKKTYSAKFILSGKKKGKKVKVSVYSYMHPTYGGLSGKVLKKVKIK